MKRKPPTIDRTNFKPITGKVSEKTAISLKLLAMVMSTSAQEIASLQIEKFVADNSQVLDLINAYRYDEVRQFLDKSYVRPDGPKPSL